MENITIRPMQPDDAMLCADMIASTLPWQRYGVTSERAVERLHEALQRDSALLVAEERDGNRLGFVWLLRHGAFDLSGYIRWIVVSPTQRSGGVGRLLLAAAEGQCRPISRDIFLLCADFNVAAQRFYERYGYSQVGILPDYVVPGVAELIYRKQLPPKSNE